MSATSWAVLEGGYRLGRWRNGRGAEEKESPVGAMVETTFGLPAFILAFPFGTAANRFAARRQTLLEEANAVGTTYLWTRHREILPDRGGLPGA